MMSFNFDCSEPKTEFLFVSGRYLTDSPCLLGLFSPIPTEVLGVVDAHRARGGVFHPGIPNVGISDQARRQDVANRVSTASYIYFLSVCVCLLFRFLLFRLGVPSEKKWNFTVHASIHSRPVQLCLLLVLPNVENSVQKYYGKMWRTE